mmetsp:Transcript_7870/g.18377  ORF Transcript_7870/g.18377 Transcript_7870/m.18377 type:complete len:211 (+) Transcript_7870:709-1341(+)
MSVACLNGDDSSSMPADNADGACGISNIHGGLLLFRLSAKLDDGARRMGSATNDACSAGLLSGVSSPPAPEASAAEPGSTSVATGNDLSVGEWAATSSGSASAMDDSPSHSTLLCLSSKEACKSGMHSRRRTPPLQQSMVGIPTSISRICSITAANQPACPEDIKDPSADNTAAILLETPSANLCFAKGRACRKTVQRHATKPSLPFRKT